MTIMSTKDRVVVLGAAGFIGFHLVKTFLENGHSVVAVDNLVRGQIDSEFQALINNENLEFLEIDLKNEDDVANLFHENDLVYNCAALNGTQNFYSDPFNVIENSSIPSIYAPKYAAAAKVKRYIYFGSSESYAGGLELGIVTIPTPENVPLTIPNVSEIRWSYAASKTLGEVAAIAAKKQFGLEIQILRIHNIYGPRMGDKHVIPDLIQKFQVGNSEVHAVEETRSFFYIEDLCEIIRKFAGLAIVPEIVNVGSSNEIRIGDLARMIAQEMSFTLEIVDAPAFPGSVKRRCPDVSLLRSFIQYTETPLEDGISKTVEWYREKI